MKYKIKFLIPIFISIVYSTIYIFFDFDQFLRIIITLIFLLSLTFFIFYYFLLSDYLKNKSLRNQDLLNNIDNELNKIINKWTDQKIFIKERIDDLDFQNFIIHIEILLNRFLEMKKDIILYFQKFSEKESNS